MNRKLPAYYQERIPLIGIGSGQAGFVYRIGFGKYAVKIPRRQESTDRRIMLEEDISDMTLSSVQRELEVCSELYGEGIRVPKPIGIFQLPLLRINSPMDFFNKRKTIGFVMEYISGERLDKFRGSEFVKFYEMMVKEAEKCLALGFFGIDRAPKNAIVTPDKKVVLVDFSPGWHKNQARAKF